MIAPAHIEPCSNSNLEPRTLQPRPLSPPASIVGPAEPLPILRLSHFALLSLFRSFARRGGLCSLLHTRALCFQHFLSTLQKNAPALFTAQIQFLEPPTSNPRSSSLLSLQVFYPPWRALLSFAHPCSLFSTLSIYIAKSDTSMLTPKSGFEFSRAPRPITNLEPLSLLALQGSLLSFAHSCSLFSTLSIYIAKKRHRLRTTKIQSPACNSRISNSSSIRLAAGGEEYGGAGGQRA
jgi:hypothetical protein